VLLNPRPYSQASVVNMSYPKIMYNVFWSVIGQGESSSVLIEATSQELTVKCTMSFKSLS
jgi:hypothetical protein